MTEPRFAHTVLVVDDEPGIIRLCIRLLERSGFKVMAVTDPQEAISVFEDEQVNLLLADIRMPGMDGFQLIELARMKQPDLAVVVMTGFGTVETAIEALRRGADGLVLKPFSGAELVQSVQRALQESRHKQDVLRLQTLRPLFAITESLFAETNPSRLQELLLEAVCGHIHCPHAGVYQRKPGQPGFKLLAGKGELFSEDDGKPERSVIGRADAWSLPLCVNRDGPGDAGLQASLGDLDFGSIMAAPLRTPMADKESGAVLLAARRNGEDVFRESDLEIFAILARQASVALENARLHEELRAYIRQVEDSQRALIQAEKMAIAGRLTASIAHEINNPLQSVQNCLHLTGREELSPEDRQNYLSMARNELERLMNTVQRMLDYYRPGALDRKPVDLNALIQRVLMFLERQIDDHSVTVHTRCAPQLPPVMAVGDQIQQVLLNLILNSLAFMPDGGKLFIETARQNNRVEVMVEDTGPGVPPDERDQIFEPFVSSKEGGTGLGLAVSYGIIAAHGGSLDLIPGRGRGACFRISLPCGGDL